MKTFLIFGITLLVTTVTAFATDIPSAPEHVLNPEQITATVREKLSPIIETALREHCGEDCPSFRIDTHFKKHSSGILDDLGFSKPAENTPPELQSITVSVLVHDKVPQGSKESLRQILAHAGSNESPVPVSIQLKPLDSLSPYLEKRSHVEPTTPTFQDNRLTWVKTTIWPFCLALSAILGLIALLFTLKNRRDLLRDQIAALNLNKDETLGMSENSLVSTAPEAVSFLETRPEDLQWLIEELASRQDVKSLNRIVTTYQPQHLTSQLKFSNATLKSLASLPANREKLNREESLTWLKESLDRAHWKRIEEQHLPLSKLARLTDFQRIDVFSKLKSASDRCVLIASIPKDKWPQLLSQISSEDRIQLGLVLSHYHTCSSEERAQMESRLSSELDDIVQSQSPCPTGILEDFTLYLTETEGKKLWQDLSLRTTYGKPTRLPLTLSIDTLVQELDPAAAVEIFTGLELSTLAILVNQLSTESRLKIIGALPRSLSDRLATHKSVGTEAQLMKARAHLLDAYRRFSSGSLVQ